MTWKKEALEKSRLYVIVNPKDPAPLSLEGLVREAVAGGADVIQLRDKESPDPVMRETALRLAQITHEGGSLFIVNDRVHVAADSGADGVHLGHEDMSLAEARRILGEHKIIGRSTHSPDQAADAQEQGADYLGFGPITSTPTKPDYPAIGDGVIREACLRIQIPFFVIGGVDHENLETLLERGATRVAIVRAAVRVRDVRATCRRFKERLLAKHVPLRSGSPG